MHFKSRILKNVYTRKCLLLRVVSEEKNDVNDPTDNTKQEEVVKKK